MAFPKEFLDIIRDRLSVSDVVSRRVKLQKSSRNFLGLCPFHREKTPSFTVNDDKGFYHCFGCGAHGDVITFEMQTNNYSFFEAVESLSGQLGLQMPVASDEEREQAKRFATLYDIMEKAADFFQKSLHTDEGKSALKYLKEKRGLSDEIIERFKLGYAPTGNKLLKILTNAHIEIDDLIRLGLVQKSQRDESIYDFFRGRVMFPIQDSRGRVIAFGGRVLDDGLPKYINSTETELFKKSHTLYGLSQARETVHNDKRIIAVEGYVDVIVMVSVGINSVVAPLGTAIGENHFRTLWKLNDKPILCFDGDAAGRKAAVRASFLALPFLHAGKSLQIAILPDGDDPDDLIKKGGAVAVNNVLNAAEPLIEIIWRALLDRININTPEDKAKFEKEIDECCNTIADATVKKFYLQELKNRMWSAFKSSGVKIENKKPKSNISNRMDEKIEKLNNAAIVKNSPDSIFNLLAHVVCFPKLLLPYLELEQIFKTDDSKINNFVTEIFSIISEKSMDINCQTLIAELQKNGFGSIINQMSSKIELYRLMQQESIKKEFDIFIKHQEKSIIEHEIQNETDAEKIDILRE
ncbi:MAG: DNA primase, partial [Rickettsiales bacterium]|nr:DNA primase [Rickettsiales bacterium]